MPFETGTFSPPDALARGGSQSPIVRPSREIERLASQVRQIETAGRSLYSDRVISSGCAEIDRLLPNHGYAAGSMVEFLQEGSGTGAMSIALTTAKEGMERGKYLLVVDRHRRFYPPAAASLGIPLDRLVVVHPERVADAIWAMDQGLRTSAVGVVIAEVDGLDDRAARRLQLAAEQGGGLGLWIRNARLARGPSWAEIQWLVRPRAGASLPIANQRRVDLRLMRCRGGRAGAQISLTLHGDFLQGVGPVPAFLTSTTTNNIDSHHDSHHEGVRNATESALRLAAELAMPTHAAKRSDAGRPAVRSASA